MQTATPNSPILALIRTHNLLSLSADALAFQRQEFTSMRIDYSWLDKPCSFEYDLTVEDDVKAAGRLMRTLNTNRVHTKISLA